MAYGASSQVPSTPPKEMIGFRKHVYVTWVKEGTKQTLLGVWKDQTLCKLAHTGVSGAGHKR
eukprot:5201656-Ditylum_brightwellii.AAC.1